MPFEGDAALPTIEIPHLKHPVKRSRDNRFAVGRDSYASGRAGMTLESGAAFPGFEIPYLQRLVV